MTTHETIRRSNAEQARHTHVSSQVTTTDHRIQVITIHDRKKIMEKGHDWAKATATLIGGERCRA
jgi:hypothetical protein